MALRQKIFAVVEPRYNNQDSLVARIYDWVMLVAIIIGIIPLMFREQTALFYVFDVVSCVIFIIDYILRWITADLRMKKGSLSFFVYPFTLMAIIDLLSILPTFNFVKNAFKLTRIIRLAKIIREIRIIRYF